MMIAPRLRIVGQLCAIVDVSPSVGAARKHTDALDCSAIATWLLPCDCGRRANLASVAQSLRCAEDCMPGWRSREGLAHLRQQSLQQHPHHHPQQCDHMLSSLRTPITLVITLTNNTKRDMLQHVCACTFLVRPHKKKGACAAHKSSTSSRSCWGRRRRRQREGRR